MFAQLIGQTPYHSEEITSQGVRTHFIDAGSAKLELLESLSPDSPVARFLEKRKEGVHHLAFEVSNIKATWKQVERLGYTPLGNGPQPGAGGKLIFFVHPRDTHGILIEFCQAQRQPLLPERIAFQDGELAFFSLGNPDAPPLVILHGAAGCTAMETEPLAQRLSKHFRVYALDFAGHGQSDPFSDTPFHPDLFIGSVKALFDHLDLHQANLFGFSLGGFIALSFASQFPGRVGKLALHATNLIWDEALVDTMLLRLDHEGIRRKSAELVRFLETMHGADNWISLFERMKDYTREIPGFVNHYTSIISMTIPTLVSAVDNDDLFDVQSPVFLYDKLQNSRLAIIPGHRHALQNIDLDLFVPLLLRHFS